MLRNKRRTEQFQRRAHRQWTGPSPAGGRQEAGGRGKGQTLPQRRHPYQTANRPPVSNQRRPEILDGRHQPRGSQPEISFPKQTQGTPDWRTRKLRLGCGGEGAPHPGRVRQSSSWLPELLGRGRHKTQAQSSLCFCGGPENWNRTQRRARSLQSSREPEQCRRGKAHTPERGKPSVAGTWGVLPTQAGDICLQRPSLPAARLNKRT